MIMIIIILIIIIIIIMITKDYNNPKTITIEYRSGGLETESQNRHAA